jgi:flagellar basal body P-ring formation protein FlgA
MSTLARLIIVICTLPMVVAAEPRLKPSPVASGAQITLGDLFEDAGAAANTPLARAPTTGQRVVFTAAALQARANMAGVRWRNLEGARQVVVEGTGRGLVIGANSQIANATEATTRTVAVLNRDVPRGEVITAMDVVFADVADATARDAVSEPETLIGKTAKRALQQGVALRASDVMDTPAVKRGELVTLIYESGGLRLSLRGRALANAAIGSVVKVANLQSNRVLDAIVDAPGSARVIPATTSARVTASLGAN